VQRKKEDLIQAYFVKIKSANKELTKREAFKDLLNRLYSGNTETERIVDAITQGAEAHIANIPRKDRIHRGSADTLYNKIIIEYENDLKKSLNHAKEQLAGYLLGQFNSGEGYNYTLIASDFIHWKVFSLDISSLDHIDKLKEDELILSEVESAAFNLTTSNYSDFYFWIDRFLFKEEKQKATLKRIEEAFGYQSNVFIECFRELSSWFKIAITYDVVQVSFEQWQKFLSIAYGKFDATQNNFLIHTYLSVFSKMLAYSVVSNDNYIDEEELKGILDGEIFKKYNINNFVDDDFFHWVRSEENFKALRKSFRLIAQEISTFNFENADEDVLKGVYQELIDLDTRHALGEYYTPDWLCERIVNEFNFKRTDRILDPSCGSGSFLRAAIHRLRTLHPNIEIETISENVYGIDIHPLSVQIAKTTMLIALGSDVKKLRKPIHINIILSNTLLSPEGVRDLFGGTFKINIDKEDLIINSQVLEDMGLFDIGIDVCEDLAAQTAHKVDASIRTLENSLKTRYKQGGITTQLMESFYSIYKGLKTVKENKRDSIWRFIIQNLYKPYFLKGRFDYIIGNPPWFTFSSIKNEGYQNILNDLAERYKVKPLKIANFPHLEIAAIFLAHCANYFLKPSSRIAFVMPRSFFTADHHGNTRNGMSEGFRLTNIWDLKDISPLFRIPSCVLFAITVRSKEKKNIPKEGIQGLTLSGRLPTNNCNLKATADKIDTLLVKWFLIRQGTSTAFSTDRIASTRKANPYKKRFKQGATIVPRSFYFIELTHNVPDFEDRIIYIKTAEAIKPDAKAPWKEIALTGQIESRFVFRTAISNNILPFALYRPVLIVLPIMIEKEKGIKRIKLYKAADVQRLGYLNSSKWFSNIQDIWDKFKTEKSRSMSSNDRLDFQRGITEQNLNQPYLVLYNSSAKDANATIVDRANLDLEFIVESKCYWIGTQNINEAYYLTTILNSTVTNKRMKTFQTTGLFGARDVHKKILDIFYPLYDESSRTHRKLAKLGEISHNKTKQFLADNPPKHPLSAIALGRLRLETKKNLSSELAEIDYLVSKIIT